MEKVQKVPTANLFAARMNYFGLTSEDGVVMSLSTKLRLDAFRKQTERIRVSSSADIRVEPLTTPADFIIDNYEDLMQIGEVVDDKVKPAPFVNKRTLGTIPETGKVLVSRYRGIVTHIERHRVSDTVDNIVVETLSKYTIENGSKITDRNSHKSTVSKILPDWQMPEAKIPGTDEFRRLDIICPPYIGKRATPSREMEEIASIMAHKNKEPFISKMDTTLDEIKIRGTNVSPFVYNINPNNQYNMIAWNVPVGFVAFSVLDQNPADKIKFSNKINTNHQGRTRSGLRNYNFTDGMFPMVQVGATGLVRELQNYATESNNMVILRENLETFGFVLIGNEIKLKGNGIFKDRPEADEVFILQKGQRRTDPNASIEETIYDPKLEGKDIYVKLPAGIPLCITELTKGLGSRTIAQQHAYRFLTRNDVKERMRSCGVPHSHIYSPGKKDRYLRIPGYMIHTHVSYSGDSFASAFMNKLNNTVLVMNNTIHIKESFKIQTPAIDDQVIRCNILFNEVVNDIMLETIQKSGILRETLSPRVPFTTYAVASGTADTPINEVRVPIKVLMNFARKERWRKAYGVPEGATPREMTEYFNSRQIRTLIMRQPCHRRHNISSFIIRVWKGNTIGIHNDVIAVKDGDLDM